MNREWVLCKLRMLAPLLVGLGLVFSCSTPEVAQEGSETHFLETCEGTCPDGMQCICGVCTKACTRQNDCSPWSEVASCAPLAARVVEQRCGEAELGAMCDAVCLTDLDCTKLATARICDFGYCRQFRQNIAPIASCMPADLAATDVLILGDVLIELSVYAEQLEQAAVAAGSLEAGQHYRNKAAGASSLLATGPLSIDNEYTSARADGPARVIIMNGGATDVLTGQCAGVLTPDCPAARAAVSGAQALFERFARDGVEHVVYFFYGDPIANPTLKDGLDLMRPLLQNVCGRSAVPCHWLDLRPIFSGHPEYVGAEGLVFTAAGATAAAAATYTFMQEQCVVD